MFRPFFPEDEERHQPQANPGDPPAAGGGQLGKTIHQRGHGETVEDRTGPVETVAPRFRPFAFHFSLDQDQAGDAQRQQHGKDASPAQMTRQQSAQKRARSEAGINGGDVDPHGPAPLSRGENRSQNRHVGAEHHGTADALQNPHADQPADAGGEGEQKHGQREENQANGEHPSPAKDVSGPPRRQQQNGGGEHVTADDPVQGDRVEAELRANRRQRQVDRRPHEGRQERSKSRHCQHRPLKLLLGHARLPSSLAAARQFVGRPIVAPRLSVAGARPENRQPAVENLFTQKHMLTTLCAQGSVFKKCLSTAGPSSSNPHGGMAFMRAYLSGKSRLTIRRLSSFRNNQSRKWLHQAVGGLGSGTEVLRIPQFA